MGTMERVGNLKSSEGDSSRSCVREPLNLLSKVKREPDSRSFTGVLDGAVSSPVFSSSNCGVEMVSVPILSLSMDASGYVVALRQSVAGGQSHSGFQENMNISHQEALASVTAQAAQARKEIQIQQCITSLPDSSPTHNHPELELLPLSPSRTGQRETSPVPESVPKGTLSSKSKSSTLAKKRVSGDGYRWRKYGEKQVKGTDYSRSYYRCTNTNCPVKKKVEKNNDGQLTEILYKGHHNHDPPQKAKCAKDGGLLPVGLEKIVLAQALQAHNSSDDEIGNEPDPKRRIKEVPRVIVQTVSDPGSHGDGYRWRKYGQKMVKGNPNPRSYYRCSWKGCPVRKQVEKAADNENALLVTYDGDHNHERPDHKSHDSSATAFLLAAAVTGGHDNDVPSDISLDRRLGSLSASDKGGDTGGKASDFGGDRVLESAQTLLSMGLSTSKGLEDDIGAKNSRLIQQPLFSKNHAAVSVQIL